MENVRPFLVLGQSQCNFVREAIRQHLHDWGLAWFARGSVVPTVIQIEAVSAGHWIEARSAPWRAVSIGLNEGWWEQAGTYFAGCPASLEGKSDSSGVGRAVTEMALEDLALLLGGPSASISRPDAGPSERMSTTGSGFLAFSCQIEGKECFQLVAWPDWIAAFRGKSSPNRQKTPLVHAALALGSEQVHVEAIVGDAELPIAEFATLAVGDVIIVDQRIEQPIAIRIEGGKIFAGGHLCASKGRKAVELVAADA
jgi:hypothetical protein